MINLVKKFKLMKWVLEGKKNKVKYYQSILAEVDSTKGWSLMVKDYFVDDEQYTTIRKI